MCGIIGIVSNRSHAEIYEAITRGTRSLAHRGPDDEGIEFLTKDTDPLTVAFGHRRLSILDLSPAGHQPMRDEITGNWITFNGEVFNFREIRPNLEQHQLQFHSDSDTEVILKGFGLRGLDAVQDWRGMFALGVWESSNRRLTLVRDRLGIKPLYYYYDGQNFVFGSEVRALLKTGLVPHKLSRAAVESYLTYGSVQQPLTIIENVYAVLPGHWLTFERGEVKTDAYWELRAEPNLTPVKNEYELVEEIREILEESVRLRMVADVPVGAFLSGGIDSSAIVSLMRRVTNAPIRTFSVYFNEKEFSEQPYAEQVSKQFGTEHHPVLVTEEDVLAKLPTILASMDQPSIDGINSYIVSEATAQSGLKVALSGLGGDEVFAGYSYFRTIGRDERIRKQLVRMPLWVRQAAASAITTSGTSNRLNKFAGVIRSKELHEHSLSLHRRLFTKEQRSKLLKANGHSPSRRLEDLRKLEDWDAHRFKICEQTDPVNQVSALDLGGYLSNTLLRDTDVMSMVHGLEVRVPLIDHVLIEKMLSVDGRAKVKGSVPKGLLVAAIGNLSNEIIDRPKRGFEFPFKRWLLGSLRPEVEEMSQTKGLSDLLETSSVERFWQDFQQESISWSRIWGIYILGKWVMLN